MDRIHQIRDEAPRSKDITLDTSSLPSESFLTANESSSFYSLTEEDSTFIVSPSKDSSSTSNVEPSITDPNLICNLSPIHKSNEIESFKIGKQIEAANILSGGVNIFDDNSYDGHELVIDDNPIDKDIKGDENEDTLEAADISDATPSKETEVVLQIDGKNVDAIDIGNGLYLYRKTGEEELAAVQIIDGDQQQQTFKFLKVRENAEGNLEVYEEIEIEVPKEAPVKDGKPASSTSQTSSESVKKINHIRDKVVETTQKITQNVLENNESNSKELEKSIKDLQESKSELNFNGKTMKFSESRKSPVIGTFTPMTYHSTQNKEGRPLTKTMVDQHLQPNRHSDNIKKTIEVNTDNCKQKLENVLKYKDENDSTNESTENSLKENIGIRDIMPSAIIDTIETKHDDNFASDLKKSPPETKATEGVKEEGSYKANEVNVTATDNKITPDAILIPNMSNKFENTVKLINQDLCNETKSNVYSSTQSVSTLVTDTLSDNTETDVEDKLVIAEDSIISDVSNEPTTKPVEMNPDSKSKSEGVVSDLDGVLKSCESIVKKIEETKKCEPQDSEVMDKNKEIQIAIDSRHTAENNESKLEAQDMKLVGKEDTLKVDSTQTNTSNLHADTIDTYKTSKQKIVEPTINTKSKGCATQPILNDIEKATKTLDFDVKMSTSNISRLKQFIVEESKDNKLMQQKGTSNSCSQNSQGDLRIEKPLQFPTMQKTIPSIEQKCKPKTEEKIDLNLVKNLEHKVPSKVCLAVPFGKWTEANRQEFLNKIKEAKVTTSNSHTKQIKQTNDLNRRDFLKKIDSQRQTNSVAVKIQDNVNNKLNVKPSSTVFKNTACAVEKPTVPDISKIKETLPSKSNTKPKPIIEITNSKPEIPQPVVNKLILAQRKEINNQDLIDKTIEGIINRALPAKATQEDKSNIEAKAKEIYNSSIVTLDDIERKMNELHGIPFVERPSHELPGLESKPNDTDNLCDTKKENPVVPYTNKHHKKVKENDRANISDEEVIEHEPITGDIAITVKDKLPQEVVCNNGAKKESIITEKDFDKFARRNSVTYENCLTVNFDKREPCNVTQSIVPIAVPVKKMSRNELMLAESKAKSTHKQYLARHNIHASKIPTAVKSTQPEITASKNYQSKVQMAYQTAITAKQQQEPITIIEDKPVKVVFVDTNAEFGALKLNVQGQELSPSIKPTNDNAYSTSESIDSDIIETIAIQNKLLENKSKVKHQRKQVLTPVEAPELELIVPKDLGLEFSPKKKRKVDEKIDKKSKSLLPKKSYLLNRSIEDEKQYKIQDVIKTSDFETVKRSETYVVHSDPISAIDNLVKAAELLETQSGNKLMNSEENETKIEQTTPAKRGRGRPRKYPLPSSESELKIPVSPQKEKKSEQNNSNISLTETEEDSSDDEIIQVNWTMGKINENIVCPICSKLFRSENVVFKHVKHCTGPSPNRSESDKRSSRRLRNSNDSKGFSLDSNSEDEVVIPRKRKSRDSKPASKHDDGVKLQEISERTQAHSKHVEKKEVKVKSKLNNLACELCGKTFRQLSYLLSHKIQHKKEEAEKLEKINKTVFCCEVCKKEFRRLHHLVQHRLIHDPKVMTARSSRKSSSEVNENKQTKTQAIPPMEKEDHKTVFHCEPCDKYFRKLHHLVEHKETHDGINKKSTPNNTKDAVKTPTLHQCDICNKTFKKLQHLMEHKDQHLETSSEKSDDKSVQSSLSTRDIIHECSLCYMVFPNEHSLKKHFVNCQRKKKQSAAKLSKTGEVVIKEESKEEIDSETDKKPSIVPEKIKPFSSNEVTSAPEKNAKQNTEKEMSDPVYEVEEQLDSNIVDDSDSKSDDLPLVTKKTDVADRIKVENATKPVIKKEEIEIIVIPDTPTPKKRTAGKEKIGITVTKKQKISVLRNIDKKIESSDDDEVRYMLNPEYQDNNPEEKFMKVRAEKRSSLQIERPNSKDLVKRRISLQHPPKILRLKTKVEARPIQSASVKKSKSLLKTACSTDSDDSDVKYSFPETVVDKPAPKIVNDKRKSISDKRKSLPGVAKRKSLGKQKINLPVKVVRKRAEAEHRCDCGQLFSSAALLSRHTTLAHTPPRIRKRRSPPPEDPKPKQLKPTLKPPKQTLAQKLTTQKQTQKQNTQIKTQVKKLRKSSDKQSDDKDTRRTALRGAPDKSRKIK
ncbi:unnamed protein product [Pieris macdunnoughi]|uniref:C2H2-type domain-containing protein n=1 Tax=Pieris macdunnoughi TaxID=345717 RepID=A0A821YII3_9NEOP|nr:unnamed protein product [Pieris macdunnoughi]